VKRKPYSPAKLAGLFHFQLDSKTPSHKRAGSFAAETDSA
jgi:hypothetical protein